MLDYNDDAIHAPEQDLFGIDPFAKAIAKCIQEIPSPHGSVVAVNGAWGSGKSSAINLIIHHLKTSDIGGLSIVKFLAWRYKSEDALAVAFVRELYHGLNPVLSKTDRGQAAMRKLAARVLMSGPSLGSFVGAIAGSALGQTGNNALEVLENTLSVDECDDVLQSTVAEALRTSDCRFLIVVDDIDRLSPDEALVIFRLVKSVGRLPNVIYLLAFDRKLTEEAVKDRYPSEGPHYLEKIVQACFDLPNPNPTALHGMLNTRLNAIFGDANPGDQDRLHQLFHYLINPEIRTPRDINRLSYGLSITYPAVRNEVDIADFLALETLRLFRPSVYLAVRSQRLLLVAWDPDAPRTDNKEAGKEYDNLFFSDEPSEVWSRLRRGLLELFPRLESVWGVRNVSAENLWELHRRVCSEAHFDTYFRFALSSYAVPASEISRLIQRADEPEAIIRTFRSALKEHMPHGRTKASVLLDEIKAHASEIEISKTALFLGALFSVSNSR